MLNSNVSTFVPRVASFSIFNSTAPKKVKIKDGRVMGENFLLSLRLFCLLRRLTFVAVLRCVHGMFTLFHLCTASMRCNRVYFHFNSIGVRSPRWVIFGELMFRYICRHFLCFLFSRWYFFLLVSSLVLFCLWAAVYTGVRDCVEHWFVLSLIRALPSHFHWRQISNCCDEMKHEFFTWNTYQRFIQLMVRTAVFCPFSSHESTFRKFRKEKKNAVVVLCN